MDWASATATVNGTPVQGSFTFKNGADAVGPTNGLILVGTPTIDVTFTPSVPATYATVIAHVVVTVNKATPVLDYTPLAASLPYGTVVTTSLLNPSVESNHGLTVDGAFTYDPLLGTKLPVGITPLHVTFTPTNTALYLPVSLSVSANVAQATQAAPIFATSGPIQLVSGGTYTPPTPRNTGTGALTWSVDTAYTTASGVTVNPTTGAITYTGTGQIALQATYAGNANYSASPSSADYLINVIPPPTISGVSPSSGPPNVATTLTLKGQNFGSSDSDINSVSYFGNNTTTTLRFHNSNTALPGFSWVDQNTAQVITQGDIAPGETVNFTITVDGVTSAPSSATFTTTLPPTISAISGPSATTRPSTLTLNASVYQLRLDGSIDVTAPVKVVWSASPQLVLGSLATSQVLVIPPNTLTAGVTYTFTATATNLRDGGSSSASVTVNVTRSLLSAAISGGAVRSVALGQSLTLDASPSFDPDSASTALTFAWSVTDASGGAALDQTTQHALTLANTAKPVVPAGVLAPGTYTATVTVSSGDGRTAQAKVTLNVVAATPASLTLADATQTYAGSAISLTPGGVPTGATVTYTYSGTDLAGHTYTNVSGTPTNAGTYTVKASLDPSVYSGTVSATATVTINPAQAAITLANSSQTYTGSSIALPSAGGVPSAAHVTYTYTGTNGTSYGPSTTAPIHPGTYAVTASDPNYTLTVTAPSHAGPATISGGTTGLNYPTGIAVDANHIYVANSSGDSITVYPLAAATAGTTYSSAPSTTISGANTGLNGPSGVAVDANHIYVANSGGNSITVYPLTATASATYSSAPSTTISGGTTGLNNPTGIAVDANHIYVATASTTYSSVPSTTISGGGTRLRAPASVAVDASHIYVINAGNGAGVNSGNILTIYPFTATASATYNLPPSTIISGGSALIFQPVGIAVDSSNIYLTEATGLKVYAYPLTVTANSTYASTSGNLFATSSAVSPPQGIAADSSHIYVTNPAINFTGQDSVTIYPAPGIAFLTIGKATPVVQWTQATNLNNGTLVAGSTITLSGATAAVNGNPFTAGSFSYQPSSITMPAKATSVPVAVTFAPTDPADYATVTTTFTVPLNPKSASSTQTISNARRPFNAPGGTVRTESEGISPLAVSSDGTVASNLSPDGKSGTLIGYLPSSGQGFAVSIAPDINGNFTATTTTVGGTSTPVSLTITGTATSAGVSGTIQPLGLTFSGTADPAAGPTAALSGIYQSSTVNAASGTTYTIVGSQGEAFVLTVAPGLVAAGTGTVDPSSGSLNVPLSSSASVTGTLTASTGSVSGTVTTGTGGTLNFAGVANLVQATNPLINFSGLGTVAPASPLSFGFVVDGVVPKTVVLRGVGPGLTAFGVGKALAQPSITLYDSAGDLLGANSAWGGTSDLTSAFAQVGAFALTPSSKDAALKATLQPGPYTVVLSDAANDAGGQALAEVYDASVDPTEATQSLVNVSILGQVSATKTLVGGFVIQGNSPKQVLIRAVGPGLASFGVPSPLASPALGVYTPSGTVLAQNLGWGTPSGSNSASASAISAAATSVGAFPLANGSADSAIVVTLAPGNYTAIVTSSGGAGTALLEIYEIH